MDEFKELHIKGTLAEKGYLKETYDNDKGDLKHELTALGKMELRDILRDPEMKREFLKMAIEEAKKHSPGTGKKIVLAAINKMRELE
jgi:hypothetical protein